MVAFDPLAGQSGGGYVGGPVAGQRIPHSPQKLPGSRPFPSILPAVAWQEDRLIEEACFGHGENRAAVPGPAKAAAQVRHRPKPELSPAANVGVPHPA